MLTLAETTGIVTHVKRHSCCLSVVIWKLDGLVLTKEFTYLAPRFPPLEPGPPLDEPVLVSPLPRFLGVPRGAELLPPTVPVVTILSILADAVKGGPMS